MTEAGAEKPQAGGQAGKERGPVLDKMRKNHPRLYEAIEWAVLGLSAGSFLLALAVYLGR